MVPRRGLRGGLSAFLGRVVLMKVRKATASMGAAALALNLRADTQVRPYGSAPGADE